MSNARISNYNKDRVSEGIFAVGDIIQKVDNTEFTCINDYTLISNMTATVVTASSVYPNIGIKIDSCPGPSISIKKDLVKIVKPFNTTARREKERLEQEQIEIKKRQNFDKFKIGDKVKVHIQQQGQYQENASYYIRGTITNLIKEGYKAEITYDDSGKKKIITLSTSDHFLSSDKPQFAGGRRGKKTRKARKSKKQTRRLR